MLLISGFRDHDLHVTFKYWMLIGLFVLFCFIFFCFFPHKLLSADEDLDPRNKLRLNYNSLGRIGIGCVPLYFCSYSQKKKMFGMFLIFLGIMWLKNVSLWLRDVKMLWIQVSRYKLRFNQRETALFWSFGYECLKYL